MFNYVYRFLENEGVSIAIEFFNGRLARIIEERSFGSEGYKGIIRELVCHFSKEKQVFQEIFCEYDRYIAPRYVEMQCVYPEAITVLEELVDEYELGLIANQPKETKNYLPKKD